MKKRTLALLLVLTMVLATLIGCASAEEVEYKDDLHIGYKIEPAHLDIQLITDAPPRIISYATIYEALVTLDGSFRVQPELCESYEITEEGKVYTWFLRKGVKFHNGEEMTADDVVASMNRWADHYGNAKNMIGDARFEKVDDYTVTIKMENPTGLLNEMIATMTQGSVIMPKSVLEDLDPDTGMVKAYIGTGPYTFGEWKEGSYIRLDRFDDYQPYGVEGEASGWYGYKTQLSKHIFYDFVADSSTRNAGIMTGEFDIVTELLPDDYQMFMDTEDLNVYKDLNGLYFLIYNKKEGLCADVNMRQAINAIVNPTEIMSAAMGNPEFYHVEVSWMPQDTANWYTDAGKENAHQMNIELAKEYLAKANYDNTPVRLLLPTNDTNFMNAGVAVKAELEAAGVPVELVTPDWTSYSAYRNDSTKYDIFFSCAMPVTVPTLYQFMGSSYAGFTNDQRIFDEAATINQTVDLATSQKLWDELQTYIWTESLSATKLAAAYMYNVYTDDVENFQFFSSGPIAANIGVRK